METHTTARTLGSLAAVVNVASLILNIVFASNGAKIRVLSAALPTLLFVAVAVNVLATVSLVWFSTVYVTNLSILSPGLRTSTWRLFVSGAALTTAAIVVSGVTLVWLVAQQKDLPKKLSHQSSIALLGAWLALWALSCLLQIPLYTVLGVWTRKRTVQSRSVGGLGVDFNIRLPPTDEVKSHARDTKQSFHSEDVTFNSPPQTPTSGRGSTMVRRSSSTRMGPGSSRTRLIKGSACSSIDSAFPAGEAVSIESAFDQWDTSSVHHEMRAALHSSPPVTRSGLETIPGSRPESPSHALDGPFLPSSPTMTMMSSSPRTAWSDTATALGRKLSFSPRQPTSSPPSSPPNFSRSASSSYHKPSLLPESGPSMHELIHPLFRPNSPHPPPIAIAGTMVTASPLAEQVITSETLARLRSNTLPAAYGKAVPSIDQSETRSNHSDPGSGPDSPSLGSPGPSIVDEADLPPILPGFVLSAGSRSSLVNYGKRKSVKKGDRSLSSRSDVI